jgi:Tol biopolymer transport system component
VDLYLCDRRGRFARRLTEGPGAKTQPSFAPDASRIAYCTQARPGHAAEGLGRTGIPWEIVTLDLVHGTRPKRLLGDPRASFKQPAFAPDGRRLAYFSDEGSPGNFHLFVLDLETGARLQLTDEPNRNDCHPAWSPDGRRLAFHAYEGLEADRANIYVLEVNGGSEEAEPAGRATDRPGISKHPVFADDDTIVFHREEPGEPAALFAVELAKGRETRLTPDGQVSKQPTVGRTRRGKLKVAFAARSAEPARRRGDDVFDVWIADLELS